MKNLKLDTIFAHCNHRVEHKKKKTIIPFGEYMLESTITMHRTAVTNMCTFAKKKNKMKLLELHEKQQIFLNKIHINSHYCFVTCKQNVDSTCRRREPSQLVNT